MIDPAVAAQDGIYEFDDQVIQRRVDVGCGSRDDLRDRAVDQVDGEGLVSPEVVVKDTDEVEGDEDDGICDGADAGYGSGDVCGVHRILSLILHDIIDMRVLAAGRVLQTLETACTAA